MEGNQKKKGKVIDWFGVLDLYKVMTNSLLLERAYLWSNIPIGYVEEESFAQELKSFASS